MTSEDTGFGTLSLAGYLGKVQERVSSLENCPWCASKGWVYALHRYRINFQESITLCTNPECLFPLVNRPLEDVLAELVPVDEQIGGKRKNVLESEDVVSASPKRQRSDGDKPLLSFAGGLDTREGPATTDIVGDGRHVTWDAVDVQKDGVCDVGSGTEQVTPQDTAGIALRRTSSPEALVPSAEVDPFTKDEDVPMCSPSKPVSGSAALTSACLLSRSSEKGLSIGDTMEVLPHQQELGASEVKQREFSEVQFKQANSPHPEDQCRLAVEDSVAAPVDQRMGQMLWSGDSNATFTELAADVLKQEGWSVTPELANPNAHLENVSSEPMESITLEESEEPVSLEESEEPVSLEESEELVSMPPQLFWRNSDNLCWLDALLVALVNCKSLREGRPMDKPQQSPVWELITKYDEICAAVKAQQTSSDGVGRVPRQVLQHAHADLQDLRMSIFKLLQPKLLCQLGRRETPVFALPVLVAADSWAESLFQLSFHWQFDCSGCKSSTNLSVTKPLPTFTSIVPDWHPVHASHLAPCNVCQKKKQKRTMVLDSVPPVFALHFVEGLPDNDLQIYSFNFHETRYSVTAIIQYKQQLKHFVTWILKPNGFWQEFDDLKHPGCKSHVKLPVLPQEIHIVFWEAETIHQACSWSPDPSSSLLAQSPDPSSLLAQSPDPSSSLLAQSPDPSSLLTQSPDPSSSLLAQSPDPSSSLLAQSPDPSSLLAQSPDPSSLLAQSPDQCLLSSCTDSEIVCALTVSADGSDPKDATATMDFDTSIGFTTLLESFEGLSHSDIVTLTLVEVKVDSEGKPLADNQLTPVEGQFSKKEIVDSPSSPDASYVPCDESPEETTNKVLLSADMSNPDSGDRLSIDPTFVPSSGKIKRQVQGRAKSNNKSRQKRETSRCAPSNSSRKTIDTLVVTAAGADEPPPDHAMQLAATVSSSNTSPQPTDQLNPNPATRRTTPTVACGESPEETTDKVLLSADMSNPDSGDRLSSDPTFVPSSGKIKRQVQGRAKSNNKSRQKRETSRCAPSNSSRKTIDTLVVTAAGADEPPPDHAMQLAATVSSSNTSPQPTDQLNPNPATRRTTPTVACGESPEETTDKVLLSADMSNPDSGDRLSSDPTFVPSSGKKKRQVRGGAKSNNKSRQKRETASAPSCSAPSKRSRKSNTSSNTSPQLTDPKLTQPVMQNDRWFHLLDRHLESHVPCTNAKLSSTVMSSVSPVKSLVSNQLNPNPARKRTTPPVPFTKPQLRRENREDVPPKPAEMYDAFSSKSKTTSISAPQQTPSCLANSYTAQRRCKANLPLHTPLPALPKMLMKTDILSKTPLSPGMTVLPKMVPPSKQDGHPNILDNTDALRYKLLKKLRSKKKKLEKLNQILGQQDSTGGEAIHRPDSTALGSPQTVTSSTTVSNYSEFISDLLSPASTANNLSPDSTGLLEMLTTGKEVANQLDHKGQANCATLQVDYATNCSFTSNNEDFLEEFISGVAAQQQAETETEALSALDLFF